MLKILSLVFILFIFLFTAPFCFALENSFVSIVNPIRGVDFWEQGNLEPITAVIEQAKILEQVNLQATWLIRFDALNDQKIIEILNKLPNHEKGLFLEVTPSWSKESGVNYHLSPNWHAAGSAFLSGYKREERLRLLDTVFEKFRQVFGYYPKSVGAWWIDAYSLDYMQKKYGIVTALIVADQYTTDNYQIWGQYFSTPYYPAKNHALHPAQTIDNKIPVVITQWAARDPVNGYGRGVEESTYSVQANDYTDYHKLDTNYFGKLLDIYTKQEFNKFGHLVIGLENSYPFGKYSKEYENQIKLVSERKALGKLKTMTLSQFASWYKNSFPNLSPQHIIIADDPLGSFKKVVWFMNPYYRAGWFYNQDGSVIRDIRQYVAGEEEICYQKACDEVNFATFSTRVLDEVTFGHKWVIDEGKISQFNVNKIGDKYAISYLNEAGRMRLIELMPRDIGVDGKISSIDSLILEETLDKLALSKGQVSLEQGSFEWSFKNVVLKIIKFLAFITIGCLVPGLILLNKILSKETPVLQRNTLSLILGLILITLLFYLLSLFHLKQFIFVYLLINLLILVRIRKQIFIKYSLKIKNKFYVFIIGLIGVGTIFQQIPTFKNGLTFPYGLGFWGPNTHDGIWHIGLINQLTKGVPPQNPIFANEILKNYHYFYDLLIAVTNYVSGIPILDLVFRFYPIIFSAVLGIGTYYLTQSIFEKRNNWHKLGILFSLYLVYFSGSFGWIVEYIKFRHLGGESAFWANQSISFNLNPPFAISLLVLIAIFQLLQNIKFNKTSIAVLTILAGTLIAFKAYAGILILATLFLVGIFKKSIPYLLTFLTSTVLSTALFLTNFSFGKQLIIFSPFWFIHSMIDSPDRVGWVRLSLARTAGLEQSNWFKFLATESISLLLFIVGNLGTRVFSLLSLTKIKTILKNTQYLSLFLFSLLALSIPILFIQAGNPWNTIQFVYYFLYTSSIIGGLVFAKIVTKLNKVYALPLILIFLAITPINSWATANGYLGYKPHALVTNEEFEALEFLESREDGIVLTYPYDPELKNNIAEPWPIFIYDSTAYVAALSKKAVYVEDEPQNQILLTDYKKRIVASKDFFSGRDVTWSNDFLRSNGIKYIYLPKFYKISLDVQKLSVKQIFENDEVRIYEH